MNSISRLPSENHAAGMPLIMDIGMNNAKDSEFYLQKGFRVVAIEANPRLAESAAIRLNDYVKSGQLIIEQVGLGEVDGSFTFYANLDNDHWSSFKREWGTREGTRYEEINVACHTPRWLFEKYGMPYYLKIDIEGNDIFVVRALKDFVERPRFISIEEGGVEFYAELWSVGCRSFKLVDQSKLTSLSLPNPPLEGKFVERKFSGETSGPFGDEAPGAWEKFGVAVERFITTVRSPSRGYVGPQHSWFDIHGKFL